MATRLGPAAVLAACWTFLPILGGVVLLTNIGAVSGWLQDHQQQGPFIYVAGFIVLAGLGLLPTYSQAVLGGWVFGAVIGTAAALAGFVGASLIGFVLAKRVGGDRVEREFARHARWAAVRDALVRSGPFRTLGIITLVRIPPNSPFSLTNLVLATSGVPLWSYLLGTAVGMLPRTAVVVWLASQIQGSLSDTTIKKPMWLIVSSIVVAVIVFTVLYQIGKHAIDRLTRQSSTSPDA
jgi:uncharacterized membrane protein YdjX (TVP38/TMEM64 family)